MTALPKKRLGRGLAALIGEDTLVDPVAQKSNSNNAYQELPIELIKSNSLNPRKSFSDADLQDLAKSIHERGVLQPIVVRPDNASGKYQIVAGERRWRAAQLAGLHEIPALVRELSDPEVLEIAIIENVQRSDLNPVEEAMGYQQLIDQFDYTQQQLADVIGKSRSHIANTLRLNTLPKTIQEMLREGKITAGHARALIATPDPQALAQKILALGLSVRQAEMMAKKASEEKPNKSSQKPQSNDVSTVEKMLSEALGLKISIDARTNERGKLVIHYKKLEQLENICTKLGVKF